MEQTPKIEMINVFIAYRQSEGDEYADRLHAMLQSKDIEVGDGKYGKLNVYWDKAAPTIDDFRRIWKGHLRTARAFILVCTPGTEKRRDQRRDWLFDEIEWWTAKRKTGPILIDAMGGGIAHVPQSIRRKWPFAQRAPWSDDDALRERIVQGIVLSERGVRFQELVRLRRLFFLFVGLFILAVALAITAVSSLTNFRAELIRNQTIFGEQLAPTRPSTASLHFAAAVETAKADWIAGSLWTLDDMVARVWLGRYLRERTPVILWHQTAPRSLEFDKSGTKVVITDGMIARIWDVRTGHPIGDELRHEKRINHALFSQDGKLIATGSSEGTAKIWDSSTGRQLGDPFVHGGDVEFVTFNPSGNYLLTLGSDHLAKLWSIDTGNLVGAPWRHDCLDCWGDEDNASNNTNYSLSNAAFCTDGKKAVTVSDIGTVRIWGVPSGLPIGSMLEHEGRVETVAFDANCSKVLTASRDKTVRLWDAVTGTMIKKLKHPDWVWSAWFNNDDTLIITAGRDGVARVWDMKSGEIIREFKQGGLDYWGVTGARFSHDGQLVVTAGSDHTARVWSVASGQVQGELMQHNGKINDSRFSPDGTKVVTTGSDRITRIWSTVSPGAAKVLRHSATQITLTSNNSGDSINGDGVNFATFSPDSQTIITVGDDGRGLLWDANTWKRRGETIVHQGKIWSARFNDSGDRVVTASADGTAVVWRVSTGESVTKPMKHGGKQVYFADFSPSGDFLVTASDDATARIWHTETGEPTGIVLQHPDEVNYATFSHDGKLIVTACNNGSARIWKVKDGRLATPPMQHGDTVNRAIFSADDSLVLTTGDSHGVRLWDANTGKSVPFDMRHDDVYTSVIRYAAFSPDGQKIASASLDNSARIWDRTTGTPLTEPLRHTGPVHTVSFSPDGHLLLTASDDHTARLWNVRTGQPFGQPMAHDWTVNSASFSPDGRYVITASMDGTARVLDITPIHEDAKVVRLRTEVATGLALDRDSRSIRTLDEKEWRERRRQLDRLKY